MMLNQEAIAVIRAACSLVDAWRDQEIGRKYDDSKWIAEAIADERTARAALLEAVIKYEEIE